MGVIIGVIVGFMMGSRSGDRGLEELREAWNTIRSSEEARDLAASGLSMAAGLLGRGGSLLAERLQNGGGSNATVRALRPTG